MPKRRYLTTPIYYVNAVPHCGHALTTLVADVEKRYWTLRGEHPHFLTGTDENGLKVMEAAQTAGEEPQAFVDRISQTFSDAFRALGVQYDDFIRTTEPRHARAVARIFEILRDAGHIYLDKYEGWYDVSAETFVKESEVVDGKSPDGNEVRWVSEQNWFFRLSAFQDRLLEHYGANPGFLMPEGRRNEVLSFVRQGLRDVCVSRTNPGWGIPVPGDPDRVVYVWFDALVNYLSATGWPDEPGWEELWPADVHWMAKEIFTRFHATLWPAMLMGAGLPLPKTVIAHGWFVFGDAKMSKSLGNVVAPEEVVAEYRSAGCSDAVAVDVARYALARFLPYDHDSNFSLAAVARAYNADLANDLGNALNRSLSMAHKFCGGAVPDAPLDPEAVSAVHGAKSAFEAAMDAHRVHDAVAAAVSAAQWLNKYVDERAPWTLAKQQSPELGTVLRSMLFAVRASAALMRPVTPAASDEASRQLGLAPLDSWDAIGSEESMPPGTMLGHPSPIFPRVELGTDQPAPAQAAKPKKEPPKPPETIEFADFAKVSLRVGRVVAAEPVEGSEKLLRLDVTVGDAKRQVIAGIAKAYQPIELIGRQVVVVANLKAAKLMGLESQGMLLAADGEDGRPILLQPERESPDGTAVH
jgi:methionyl-tRNA synthetase